MTLRAGIYCRVSTLAQSKEDRYSLGSQETENRTFCAEHGWTVEARFVVSEVVSGHARVTERPGLAGQLTALESGDIDILVVHDPDRLSRNQVSLGVILDRLERAQKRHPAARLAFCLHDFEDTAQGRFVLGARVFAAEITRERILEGTLRGKRTKASGGKPVGFARPPFGLIYSATKDRYLANPETILDLPWMFAQADAGVSVRQIGFGLERRGVMPPYHDRSGSTTWGSSTVDRILRNRNYVGEGFAFRQSVGKRGGRRYTNRDQTVNGLTIKAADDPTVIRLPDGVYPIAVDPALFARVQRRLAANTRETVRPDRNPEVGLFRRGYAVCAECGRNLVVADGKSGGGRAPYYVCPEDHAAILVGAVDPLAWRAVDETLRRPQIIEERLSMLRAADDAEHAELDAADRVIANIVGKQSRLAKAVTAVDDDDAAAPLLTELKALCARKRAVEDDRETIRLRSETKDADRAAL